MVDGTKTAFSSCSLLQGIRRTVQHFQVVMFTTRLRLNITFGVSHSSHQADSAGSPESDTPVRDGLRPTRTSTNHSRREWMSGERALTHLGSDRPWVEVWLAHVCFFLLALIFVFCHQYGLFSLIIPSSNRNKNPLKQYCWWKRLILLSAN